MNLIEIFLALGWVLWLGSLWRHRRASMNTAGPKKISGDTEPSPEPDWIHHWMRHTREAVLFLDERLRVKRANDLAKRMFGVDRGYLWEGRRSPDLFTFLRDLQESEEAVIRSATLRDPEPRWLVLSGIRLAEGGYLVLAADDTRIRVLEEHQTRLMRQISHELRTPITNLRASLELLEEKGASRLVQIFRRNLDRLERLVEALSRMQTLEEWTARKETLDLAQILRTLVELFEPRVPEGMLMLELPERQVARWVGDRFLLESALFPVLDNAVQFRYPEGRIWVRLMRTEHAWEIEVEDEGRGISPEWIHRVWEPFFQRDGGTGLGLSLVRTAVAQLGGEVTLTSREGYGTRVVLRLPDTREEEV